MKFVSYFTNMKNPRIGLLQKDFVIDLERAEKAYRSESINSELGSSLFDGGRPSISSQNL
jgi:hypothetical protein